MLRRGIGVVTAGLVLAAAGDARAGERFAATDGAGTACTAVAPCPLFEATFRATAGDVVTVLPGTYARSVFVNDGVTLRGQPGAAVPVIQGEVAAGLDATIRRLRVEVAGSEFAIVRITAVTLDDRSTAEQLRITGSATAGFVVGVQARKDGVVRDTTIDLTGEQTFGALIGTATFVNTTVRTGGTGVSAEPCVTEGNAELTLVNTIVRGGTGPDLDGEPNRQCSTNGPTGLTGTIVARGSNFRADRVEQPVVQPADAPNQTAQEPLLDAALRPLAGSPTIDAGAAHPLLGAAEVDGAARIAGAAVDIGAAEFAAAPPAPPADPGPGPGPGPEPEPAGQQPPAGSAPAPAPPAQQQQAPPASPPAGPLAATSTAGAAPVLSALELKAKRLKRGRATSLTLTTSAPGTLTLVLRRGTRKVRTTTKKLTRSGKARVALSAKGLKRGTYRLTLTLKDAAGRTSKARTATLRVT